ncbi:MAG: hypothetical protein HAW66_06535 [Shewanella sp.]|nr:hypothetical protein [Shewanella sp.]
MPEGLSSVTTSNILPKPEPTPSITKQQLFGYAVCISVSSLVGLFIASGPLYLLGENDKGGTTQAAQNLLDNWALVNNVVSVVGSGGVAGVCYYMYSNYQAPSRK